MLYSTRSLAPLAATFLLVGCGGGGGGGDLSPAAAGIGGNTAEGFWTGTASTGSRTALAVLENGETWGIYSDGTFITGAVHGTLTGNGSSLAGSIVDLNFVDGVARQASVAGTVAPKASANVTVQPGGAQVALAYEPSYDQPASLVALAGAYTMFGRSGNGTTSSLPIVINSNGRFAVTDGTCSANGIFTPRPTGKNVFNMTVTFNGICAIGTGKAVTGIGVLDEGTLVAMGLLPDRSDGLLTVGIKTVGGPAPAPAPGPGAAPAPAPGAAPAPAPGAAPAPAPAAPLGGSFSAVAPADVWHSLSSSDDGQVMVAGQAGTGATENPLSFLSLSIDGGQTFVENIALGQGIWIASDVSGDGNRIAAVQFQGNMFVSVDRGATFTPVPLPTGITAPAFESVTLSQDGTRIAAAVMNGPVIVGTIGPDGTTTWINPVGLPAAASWRSIDSSAAGNVIVAVAQDPAAFISVDGGATWTPLAVSVGGAPVLDQNWYRVKVSGDGNTIAMVANGFGGSSGNGIYVSKDAGASFTRALELPGDYTGITMSADGGVIAATASDRNDGSGTGVVLMSTDGGISFAPLAVSVGGAAAADSNWRAITISSDATRMAVAAGSFLTNSSGRIYLSTGTRP